MLVGRLGRSLRGVTSEDNGVQALSVRRRELENSEMRPWTGSLDVAVWRPSRPDRLHACRSDASLRDPVGPASVLCASHTSLVFYPVYTVRESLKNLI